MVVALYLTRERGGERETPYAVEYAFVPWLGAYAAPETQPG